MTLTPQAVHLALGLACLTAIAILSSMYARQSFLHRRSWSALMKRFCAPREIRPAHPHAFTIKIGLITYKGSKAEVRDDGLYLAPPLHYRLGLRPLLIPWNQIALSHDRAGNVAEDALHLHKEFGFFSHKFTIGHPSATELWCPQELSSLIFTKIAHLPRLSGRAV